MSDLLIQFAELIYPNDFDKQTKLMEDIIYLGVIKTTRLTEFTPSAFREAYEKNGIVPLLPVSYLEDMAKIMEIGHPNWRDSNIPHDADQVCENCFYKRVSFQYCENNALWCYMFQDAPKKNNTCGQFKQFKQ